MNALFLQRDLVIPDTALFCREVAPRIAARGGELVLALRITTDASALETTIDLSAREVRPGTCDNPDIFLQIARKDLDAILAGKAGPNLLERITLITRGGADALRRLAASARGRREAPGVGREIGAVEALDTAYDGPDSMMHQGCLIKGRRPRSEAEAAPAPRAEALAMTGGPAQEQRDVADIAAQNLACWLNQVAATIPADTQILRLERGGVQKAA